LDAYVETRKKKVVYDVVLLFENPHASVEAVVIESVYVLEVLKTNFP